MTKTKKTFPIIQVEDISAVFQNKNGGLMALEKVSFSVQSHHFICILGPSGSGKSTLLRILGGLLPPTSGKIFFDGFPILRPTRRIGIVFQDSTLMPWRTVLENITLPLEIKNINQAEADERAHEMVRLIDLDGFENWLPVDLSGGMAQRVAIARALIYNPDLLLLDEPFGSLDALTREQMGMELLRIWQVSRNTVIMVTHSISEALMLADRILVFSPRPGKVSLDMPVELDRPRHEEIRYTSEFTSMARRLRGAIRENSENPHR